MAGNETTVHGLPDLREALSSIPDKLRRRAIRNALAAAARPMRDVAKAEAPVLQASAPYRKAGTVRGAIAVRTSKRAKAAGDVGVFINVRPPKRGMRGAKSPNDPYYWVWQHFGWTPASGPRGGRAGVLAKRARRRASRAGAARAIPGKKFLNIAAGGLSQALSTFTQRIGPQIQKLNGGKAVQL